jgi:copper chaperone CopZ
MLTKAIFGLAALFGLAGVGLSLAETRTGCCYPGAACCVPGSPCCDTPPATGGCCAPGADCCFPGSPCCVPGAGCCDLTAVSADVAPAPRAKADRKGGCCAGGCCAADQPAQPAKTDAATSKIAVDGMSCAGCAKTVGKAVSAVEGVESAVADVKTKTLTVVAKKGATPSPKAMWEAVEKAGYKPTRIEGAAGTFEKKPEK